MQNKVLEGKTHKIIVADLLQNNNAEQVIDWFLIHGNLGWAGFDQHPNFFDILLEECKDEEKLKKTMIVLTKAFVKRMRDYLGEEIMKNKQDDYKKYPKKEVREYSESLFSRIFDKKFQTPQWFFSSPSHFHIFDFIVERQMGSEYFINRFFKECKERKKDVNEYSEWFIEYTIEKIRHERHSSIERERWSKLSEEEKEIEQEEKSQRFIELCKNRGRWSLDDIKEIPFA